MIKTSTEKKIKLVIFIILFFTITPILVFYANGYIFSNGWSLLSTGGIYVTNAPIGSKIYLNGKLKNTTSFFQRDILIKNLSANTYNVTVNKENYNTWTKKIKVINNLVSNADVFILPEKVDNKEIAKYISQDVSSSTSSNVRNPEYDEFLALFNQKSSITIKNNASTTIDFKSNLGTKYSPVMNGKLGLWDEGGKIFVKWFGNDESAPKYMCNENDISDCQESKMVFELPKQPTRLNFLSNYEGVILVSTDGMIFAVQIEDNPSKTIQMLYRGNNPDFRLVDGYIYVKDGAKLYEILL